MEELKYNNENCDSRLNALLQELKAYAKKQNRITSATDVFKHLMEYKDKQKEYFITITLNGASKIIETRVIHVGTVNQSLVHPREVFKDAIADGATGIIIAHNHPSGTLEPSRADIAITKRLDEVSRLVGIELLDHVILAETGFYSFSDEGEL